MLLTGPYRAKSIFLQPYLLCTSAYHAKSIFLQPYLLCTSAYHAKSVVTPQFIVYCTGPYRAKSALLHLYLICIDGVMTSYKTGNLNCTNLQNKCNIYRVVEAAIICALVIIHPILMFCKYYFLLIYGQLICHLRQDCITQTLRLETEEKHMGDKFLLKHAPSFTIQQSYMYVSISQHFGLCHQCHSVADLGSEPGGTSVKGAPKRDDQRVL